MHPRIKEIEARLAAIRSEAENQDADLDALTAEAKTLNEERTAILNREEKRMALLQSVAETAPTVRSFGGLSGAPVAASTGFDIGSAEYRSAWLKTLMGRSSEMTDAERRSYAAADEHNAIPTIVAEKFVEKVKTIAPMLNEITLMRVAGNLKIVMEGTNNAATKHTENSSVTPAEDTVTTVTLGANEFMKLIGISNTAQFMSVDAFEDWLVSLLARDIARAIDKFIIDDTTGGIGSITWTGGTNAYTHTTGHSYGGLCATIALLNSAYASGAKWLTNSATLWSKLYNLTDSSGRPLLVTDPAAGPGGRLLGFPVMVDDYVSTTGDVLYFGNFKEGIMGNMSVPIEVKPSKEAGFASNSTLYRGLAAFDCRVVAPSIVKNMVVEVTTTTTE